jgi:hypothetical protein
MHRRISGTHRPAPVARPQWAAEAPAEGNGVTGVEAASLTVLDAGGFGFSASLSLSFSTCAVSLCASSRALLRNSPSSVNKRRSVTVKPESCLFSAMAYPRLQTKLKLLH